MFFHVSGLVLEHVVQIVVSVNQALLVGLKSVDLDGQVIALESSLIVEAVLLTNLND